MKPKERTKKMPVPDRVRLAWINTPGNTAEEKQRYVFFRHATDALQRIFGVGSAAYAQQFLDQLRDDGLFICDDGSYNWSGDMSNYNGKSGGSGGDDDSAGGQLDPPVPGPSRRGPRPSPRQRAVPEPPAEDVATDVEETATDEAASNDLQIVLSHAPWMAATLRAAALLGQIQPDARLMALEAIRKIAALSGEDIPQALNMLNSIFPEPPPAEPEDEE